MSTSKAEDVRCVTCCGHVDHGKTTVMDALLAANNIISQRMAGKLRYLDSREDEQERGITMESSAVSLKFQVKEGGSSLRTYIINMIDTPGHVDFSSEVSTASRLVDGALVLVDAVEGVCTQTIAVLRQAWQDRLKPILVINKIDRLITELKLAPVEAYHHLAQLIEQVNAVMGGFFASERMEDDLRWREERERRLASKKEAHAAEADAIVNEGEEFQEKDDEDIYFAPERGNVIFASAIDGWGFRVGKFAQLFAAKLGIKEGNLRRVLWGDFYLDPKTKRVISHKHLRGRALKPLFVQFVLENLWAVYDAVSLNPNPEKVNKIVTSLNLKIPPRDLKSKDARQLLSQILTQWLPLSTGIIQAVIDVVPPPSESQRLRIPKMLYPDLHEATVAPKSKLEENLYACDARERAAVVAYVSKMFVLPDRELPENKARPLTAEEMRARARQAREARERAGQPAEANGTPIEANGNGSGEEKKGTEAMQEPGPGNVEDDGEAVLGFARLYSGVIKRGKDVRCVLPKYDNALGPSHPRNRKRVLEAHVEGLYLIMGRELVPVESVRAGNVFAIRGLEGKVWRSATICAPGEGETDVDGCLVNLGAVYQNAAPIVRIAVEPESPADMPKLVRGLKLLSQADPCVETFQQQTGEHVILGAGELHLERCLRDLKDRFAGVAIHGSAPIVPFRETAVKGVDMPPPKFAPAKRGTIKGATIHNLVKFTIRAAPLPKPLHDFILDNLMILKRIQRERKSQGEEEAEEEEEVGLQDEVYRKPTVKPENFWTSLKEECVKVGGEWADVADRIWAFGPQGAGACILVDTRWPVSPNSLRRRMDRLRAGEDKEVQSAAEQSMRDLEGHVETGFQFATFQGPLCAEPVEGLAYFLESFEVDENRIEEEKQHNRIAQVTGSLISAVREACRNGLLDWSPRLMLAMYTCDIQASTEVLGKVYGVVARRRGRIVSEEMKEGTSFFSIRALLPVVESFGFADDIRKRTSGAASPQLIFSGYELLDQDPFWVPTTEEELEDLGDKADRSNVAKTYMDAVRERKGMFVDRKIVEFAEKQRTLKR
ncbi:P-loop containing nucleoside triphosphate hydrolase protein [Gloeophyllum trabeum ATCC 11539]|uniref:Ribosome assembly protein 1 n=1 Tax=Gloeophyllum trabeum (strain ATCC 11539 / FP-39264 / Madison 617) TaxID=670483 RepID=S7Q5H3_GLOTA|nr:P-loop containing nucleoside triphosphate hydrolase protein [Gloeophyllum trabeum ATCC 11539]EPQ54738.1 P-loop containing nucleoside triphosphate hydrolase protein [Gloeophyllum trabeum ATCC 11539]